MGSFCGSWVGDVFASDEPEAFAKCLTEVFEDGH